MEKGFIRLGIKGKLEILIDYIYLKHDIRRLSIDLFRFVNVQVVRLEKP